MLLDDLRNICLQNILKNDFDIIVFRKFCLQNRRQSSVHFKRHYFFGFSGKALRQGSDTGTDLDRIGVFVYAGCSHHLRQYIRFHQKVLPQALLHGQMVFL
ncbi:hypothetical protein SDC9_82946 [bioreactor metagenome]|uniref:Uncharacterized protein n=1 Tax=bioreactor metagenome TaxID=1076179 RepID=A0A644Z8N3_9ZZZZ